MDYDPFLVPVKKVINKIYEWRYLNNIDLKNVISALGLISNSRISGLLIE